LYFASAAGSVRTLPRFTSPKVRSMLDMPDMKAYSDLANAYGSDNTDKLLRVAEQHMTTFSSVSHSSSPLHQHIPTSSYNGLQVLLLCCTTCLSPGGAWAAKQQSYLLYLIGASSDLKLPVTRAAALQDNNVGLVKQVLASRPMRTIQRLTQTYVTLSLADIAKAAGLKTTDEAEAMILR
jgi:hypothetical protein